MVEKSSASYTVPECMTLKPRGPGTCLFSLQIANAKCIGSDLPVKWAVLKLAFFHMYVWLY